MKAFARFRRWLGRLISGDSHFELMNGGIGYPGSVSDLCGHVHRAARASMPASISCSTGYRWVSDLAPSEVRIVVEAPR